LKLVLINKKIEDDSPIFGSVWPAYKTGCFLHKGDAMSSEEDNDDHVHYFCWLLLVLTLLLAVDIGTKIRKHEQRLRQLEINLNITVPADCTVEIDGEE